MDAAAAAAGAAAAVVCHRRFVLPCCCRKRLISAASSSSGSSSRTTDDSSWNWSKKGGSMAGKAVIKVIGVGGAGCNAVNRMVSAKLPNVEFWAMNTDAQALSSSLSPNKLQIGKATTLGRGAGGRIEVGEEAATESLAELSLALEGADLIFIAAGMGGGTGSGAGPVVARLAKAMGALTIGIVTQPFAFEGRRRAEGAKLGTLAMRSASDTLVVVPNDRLLEVVQPNTSVSDAFRLADDILRQGVQGISDIITVPGLVNVDFADVRAIMSNAGSALLGIAAAGKEEQEEEGSNSSKMSSNSSSRNKMSGSSSSSRNKMSGSSSSSRVDNTGGERAAAVAEAAIMSPLLLGGRMEQHQQQRSQLRPMGVVYNVTGGPELTLHEVNAVAERIARMAHPDANVIFGAVIDEGYRDMIKVTVVATGFGQEDEESDLLLTTLKTVDDDILEWQRSSGRSSVARVPDFLRRRSRKDFTKLV